MKTKVIIAVTPNTTQAVEKNKKLKKSQAYIIVEPRTGKKRNNALGLVA